MDGRKLALAAAIHHGCILRQGNAGGEGGPGGDGRRRQKRHEPSYSEPMKQPYHLCRKCMQRKAGAAPFDRFVATRAAVPRLSRSPQLPCPQDGARRHSRATVDVTPRSGAHLFDRAHSLGSAARIALAKTSLP